MTRPRAILPRLALAFAAATVATHLWAAALGSGRPGLGPVVAPPVVDEAVAAVASARSPRRRSVIVSTAPPGLSWQPAPGALAVIEKAPLPVRPSLGSGPATEPSVPRPVLPGPTVSPATDPALPVPVPPPPVPANEPPPAEPPPAEPAPAPEEPAPHEPSPPPRSLHPPPHTQPPPPRLAGHGDHDADAGDGETAEGGRRTRSSG